MHRKREIFFGWRVVVAVFVLAVFGWGIGFYGPPIYLHTLNETRGWPLAVTSSAVTVHLLAGAAVVAGLPTLYRRLGMAAVTKGGAIALAAGTLGWALAQQPWQLFAAALVSGAGWATMGGAAVNAIIAPWFVRMRPAALSLAYNGSSVGGAVFSPIWVAAIGYFGFAAAALLIGLAMVAVMWVLAEPYYGRRPDALGLLPDGDLQPARAPLPTPGSTKACLWSNRRFLTLAGGMSLALFAQIGLLAHLFSLLTPALGEQFAGLAVGAATVVAIAGRTLTGAAISGHADRRLFAAASYAVQIMGSLLLLLAGGENIPALLAGVLLFGAGIGNATSLPPLIAQSEFAPDVASRAVPLMIALAQASFAFAPAVFGLLRELGPRSGAAVPDAASCLFVAAALLQGLAIAVLLSGRRRPARYTVAAE